MSYRVGLRTALVPDDGGPAAIPLLLMYPTEADEDTLQFGPYSFEAARDAAAVPGPLPLVLISHGTGSSQFVFRTMAQYLARQGWAVAVPEHPFNNRNDDSLGHTRANLINRPRHLRRVADWVIGSSGLAVDGSGYAAIGHSMGGYSVLALAGGVPATGHERDFDGVETTLDVEHDDRVRALVLLAPATAWFRKPGALSAVRAPVLMLLGEKDTDAHPQYHGAIVINGLPAGTPLEHRTIPNANHFAFQSVFPPSMNRLGFRPAMDEEGFDRPGFLQTLYPELATFLRKTFAK